MTERTVAVIQARFTSTRLPGKVLSDVSGRPMLLRQVERVRRSRSIDQIVVATSVTESDDAIAEVCRDNGIGCFRGSLDDVLDRFYSAAVTAQSTIAVRLTADCPLADPEIIDHVVTAFSQAQADYASNTLRPTYPDGLDVEVVSIHALHRAWQNARLPSEREHVTPYLYKHPELFRLHGVEREVDLSHLRWTVDTPADLAFMRAVYEVLLPRNAQFSTADVLALLHERPQIAELNTGFQRNEGYLKSLERDAITTNSESEQQ